MDHNTLDLPSNVALCVNPNETYVKVTSGEYTYYMAEACLIRFWEKEIMRSWSAIQEKNWSTKSMSRSSHS
mgnify:CR=1 FL=1